MKQRWAIENSSELEQAIPGFDPYRLGRVAFVHLDFIESEDDSMVGVLNVRIRVAYWMPDTSQMLVDLALYDVRQMIMPELGSAVFELSELQITDVSARGLEGVRREVVDHGADRRFYILCRQVEVMGVLSRDGDSTSQIWPRGSGS